MISTQIHEVSNEHLTRRIATATEQTCSYLRLLENGSLELEVFDYSDAAFRKFGKDVTTVYIVEPSGVDRLISRWTKDYPGTKDEGSRTDMLAWHSPSAESLLAWLSELSIPFDIHRDPPL